MQLLTCRVALRVEHCSLRGRKLLPDRKQLFAEPATRRAGLSMAGELISPPVPAILTAARETGCASAEGCKAHRTRDKLALRIGLSQVFAVLTNSADPASRLTLLHCTSLHFAERALYRIASWAVK